MTPSPHSLSASEVLPRSAKALSRAAWSFLGFLILVILWGAVVRATGSGAGCRDHWPTCNGELVPSTSQVKTWIEYIHRLTSGLSGLLAASLVVWSLRVHGRKNPITRASYWLFGFILTEGLVGAAIVLLRWVEFNPSVARAISMGLHLINTFSLLWAALLFARRASGAKDLSPKLGILLGSPKMRVFYPLILLLLLTGIGGTLAALGDLLFQAESFAHGLAQDFGSEAQHFSLRLRVFHPIFATLAALLIPTRLWGLDAQAQDKKTLWGLVVVGSLQLLLGSVNVLLLAPLALQIAHLLLADVYWLLFGAFIFQHTGLAAVRRGPQPE